MRDTIPDVTGVALEWTQPRWHKDEYALRAGDAVVAGLRFKGWFQTSAVGESAAGCWTFQAKGLWRSRLLVRACESDADIAVFRSRGWRYGLIELADGRRVHSQANFWHTRLELYDEGGGLLASFRIRGALRTRVEVAVAPAATSIPEMPWLLMLGCYHLVLMRKQATAAAAG